MPKLTPETQQARRQQIITAALDCFSSKGFSATSMTDIIKASGLSAGSIYSHFKSKDEILQESANFALATAEDLVTYTAGRLLSPQELFLHIINDHPLNNRFNIIVQVIAETSTNKALQEIVNKKLADARATMQKILTPWAENQPGATEKVAARASNQYMTVFHGYIMRLSVDPTVDRQELAEIVAELLPA